MNVNFHSVNDNDLPSEQEFNNIPTLELVADADNADAPSTSAHPSSCTTNRSYNRHTRSGAGPDLDTDVPLPGPFIPETPDPHNEIGSTYDELHVTIVVLYVVPVEYITYLVVRDRKSVV